MGRRPPRLRSQLKLINRHYKHRDDNGGTKENVDARTNVRELFCFAEVTLKGVTGYGWVEVMALPSYFLLHWWFRAIRGKTNYSPAAIWYLSCVICMFGWQLGPWTWLFFFVPFVVPSTLKNLRALLSLVWEKRKITLSLPKA